MPFVGRTPAINTIQITVGNLCIFLSLVIMGCFLFVCFVLLHLRLSCTWSSSVPNPLPKLLWQTSKPIFFSNTSYLSLPLTLIPITMGENCFEALPCKPVIWQIWRKHFSWWQQWMIQTPKYRNAPGLLVKFISPWRIWAGYCDELFVKMFLFWMLWFQL